jgi:uncharacterized protein (DUF1778 family)
VAKNPRKPTSVIFDPTTLETIRLAALISERSQSDIIRQGALREAKEILDRPHEGEAWRPR